MPSAVSCTGISSSTVTRCTAVRCERSSVITVSAWLLIGPTLASPASSVLTLRNWAIRPVGGASSTTASYSRASLLRRVALHRLVDLAGQQHVAHARRDGGREVDDAEPVERLAGAAEPVVHREVLQQRRLGVDVPARTTVAAVRRAPCGDPALLVGQRGDVEELGDALAALDLAQQHVLAAGGQRQRQRGGDRRLAGAALAGDDVQAHVGPVGCGCGLTCRSSSPRAVPRARCDGAHVAAHAASGAQVCADGP